MTSFTDKFSDDRVPPSLDSYAKLDIVANTQTCWPSMYNGVYPVLPEILDVTCLPGNILLLPPVEEVSTGQSLLLRNVGTNTLIVQDSNMVTVLTLAPGVAEFLWVTNNVQPGAWGTITYGAGSSAVSAGALAGLGTKATGSTLSVAAPTLATAGNLALTTAHRGTSIEFTAGVAALSMALAVGYGGDFYCFVKNAGTGLVTLTPSGGELIEGQVSLGLQPSESLLLFSNGLNKWYTVGYGRSLLYQFSQLVLDVSAGSTFTLSSTQASNKMITLVGNPATNVSVVVPDIVSVYYVANNLTTAVTTQIKTAAVSGAAIGQTQRAVLLCDGTSVTAAQSAVVNSAVNMLDGSVSAPSLNFASKTNTGVFKFSTQGIGLTVNGAAQLTSNGAGVDFPLGLTGTLGYTPSGSIAANTVQGAIAELDAEKAPVASPSFTGNAVVAGTLVMGSAFGFRNKVINGNFGVNQRAYSSGATVGIGLYGHDRWKMVASGDTYTFNTTANITTITIPVGKVLRHVIEGANLQSGTHVLSWSGTSQGKIGAGSISASGVTGAATGGTDLTIEFGPGTVSKVQFEEGLVATPFEGRPYGLELALCQRYYERRNYNNADACFVGQVLGTTAALASLGYTEKRAAPSIVISGAIVPLNATGSSAGGTWLASQSNQTQARLGCTAAAGLVAGNACSGFANATGQYIEINAEL